MQKMSRCNRARDGAIMTGEHEWRGEGNRREKGINLIFTFTLQLFSGGCVCACVNCASIT